MPKYAIFVRKDYFIDGKEIFDSFSYIFFFNQIFKYVFVIFFLFGYIIVAIKRFEEDIHSTMTKI